MGFNSGFKGLSNQTTSLRFVCVCVYIYIYICMQFGLFYVRSASLTHLLVETTTTVHYNETVSINRELLI